MSPKLKNEFKQAMQFKSPEEKVEHDSKILMFKFLSIIEEEMEKRNMNKKDLAIELGTSASYITQLFRGTKNVNLIKLAQFQRLFNIEFDITVMKKPMKKKKEIKRTTKERSKTLVV
jgi:ribosome-binding protein aMBF1 (putative translation factor)